MVGGRSKLGDYVFDFLFFFGGLLDSFFPAVFSRGDCFGLVLGWLVSGAGDRFRYSFVDRK